MKTLAVHFTMNALHGEYDIVNIEVSDASARDLLKKPLPEEINYTMNFHHLCAILRHVSKLRGYNGRYQKAKLIKIEEIHHEAR